MPDPRPVLQERLERRRAAVRALERRDERIALARLVAFAAVVGVTVTALGLHRIHAFWVVLPAALFGALALTHDRSLRALARARRAVGFHEAALRRLGEDWRGTGDAGERYASADHPYALDLDLFGPGDLFELLCVARTRAGADALARWLLAPAPAAEVRARQRAVAELTPRLDLREDLAILGEDVQSEVNPDRLAAWAEGNRVLPPWLSLVAAALSAASILALAGWLSERLHPGVFAIALGAEWLLARVVRDRLHRVLGGVERPGAELLVVAEVLARMEREPFADARLGALRAALGEGRARASARIRAL